MYRKSRVVLLAFPALHDAGANGADRVRSPENDDRDATEGDEMEDDPKQVLEKRDLDAGDV